MLIVAAAVQVFSRWEKREEAFSEWRRGNGSSCGRWPPLRSVDGRDIENRPVSVLAVQDTTHNILIVGVSTQLVLLSASGEPEMRAVWAQASRGWVRQDKGKKKQVRARRTRTKRERDDGTPEQYGEGMVQASRQSKSTCKIRGAYSLNFVLQPWLLFFRNSTTASLPQRPLGTKGDRLVGKFEAL